MDEDSTSPPSELQLSWTGSFQDPSPGTATDMQAAVATHLADETSNLTLSPHQDEMGPSVLASPRRISHSLLPQPKTVGRQPYYSSRTADNSTRVGQTGVKEPELLPGPLRPSGETRDLSPLELPLHYTMLPLGDAVTAEADADVPLPSSLPPGYCQRDAATGLSDLPNELLFKILGYLDVCDLLSTSRTSHHLRDISVAPVLHALRLRRTRAVLGPMLYSPSRPTLADLLARSIFLTHTTVVSRRLARSFVSIRLSRRLAARPSAEVLAQRCVLPPECVPGVARGVAPVVAPALVARKRAVERERVKDTLRRWVERVWRGEVEERSEGVRKWDEKAGVGRVWRLTRFWERVGRGE